MGNECSELEKELVACKGLKSICLKRSKTAHMQMVLDTKCSVIRIGHIEASSFVKIKLCLLGVWLG